MDEKYTLTLYCIRGQWIAQILWMKNGERHGWEHLIGTFPIDFGAQVFKFILENVKE